MPISIRLSNSGIHLSLDEGDGPRLSPVVGTPQDRPRRSYVYAHLTREGKYFYIGKGTGNRAWSGDRHPIWFRYVDNHLMGEFSVKILQDDLSPEQADELESSWIAQESDTLVNWINMGRKLDFAKLDQFHSLRNANRELIAIARVAEGSRLEAAVASYVEAISLIERYADIDFELGLVGQLLREHRAESGRQGELVALDRLTLCLIKLGRANEAATHVEDYFKKFPADARLAGSTRILKRVSKALSKTSADSGSARGG